MGLYLRYSIKGNANRYQKRCPTEIKGHIKALNKQFRHYTYNSQINSAHKGKPCKHPVYIIRCSLTWSDPRDKTAVFLKVFSYIDRIKYDSRIKITEKEYETHI